MESGDSIGTPGKQAIFDFGEHLGTTPTVAPAVRAPGAAPKSASKPVAKKDTTVRAVATSDMDDEEHHDEENDALDDEFSGQDSPRGARSTKVTDTDTDEVNLTAADIAEYYSGSSSTKYLNDIGKWTLLSAAEEIELASKAREGNEKAMHKLIESNLRLVVNIVKHYQKAIKKGNVTFDDLVQEGNMGLMHAVRKYNPDLNYRFSTYAVPWINQYVRRSVLNTSHTIRLPVYLQTTANKKHREGAKSNEEGDVIGQIANTVSLDAPIGHSNGDDFETLGERFADTSENPEDALANKKARALLMEWIECLKPRERRIIYARYGLHDGTPVPLADLGKELGVSSQAINMIQSAAQRKLLELAKQRNIELRHIH